MIVMMMMMVTMVLMMQDDDDDDDDDAADDDDDDDDDDADDDDDVSNDHKSRTTLDKINLTQRAVATYATRAPSMLENEQTRVLETLTPGGDNIEGVFVHVRQTGVAKIVKLILSRLGW